MANRNIVGTIDKRIVQKWPLSEWLEQYTAYILLSSIVGTIYFRRLYLGTGSMTIILLFFNLSMTIPCMTTLLRMYI